MCDISIPSVLANSLSAEFAYEPDKSVYINNSVSSSTSTYITADASIAGGISLTGFSTSADVGYGASGTYYMQVETTQVADSWAYIWAANANNNAIFLFNAYHSGGAALALGNIGIWEPNTPAVLTSNTTYYMFITFSKVDSNSIVTLKVYNSSKEKIIDMTEPFTYNSSLEGTGNVQLGIRGGGMPFDYIRYYRFAFFRSSLTDSQISDILTNDSYKNATTATAIGGGGGGDGGDGGGGVPCFVAGTKVLTAAGYKAVETLASSDKIVTADGRTVAFNLYSTHVKSATKETAPYVIPANTFGSKSPASDLTLSPLHAIQSHKGVWQIPKYAALTHSAIHQVCLGEQMTYYHVELPNFFTDNIVAEGTVVESYGLKQTKGMKNVYKFNTSLNGFTRISNATSTVRK